MEKGEIRAVVYGRVQMVMFRDFVRRTARALGLAGYVRNLADGSVEVVVQGQESHLQEFVEHLRKGPLLAHVERVDVERRKPQETFDVFSILY